MYSWYFSQWKKYIKSLILLKKWIQFHLKLVQSIPPVIKSLPVTNVENIIEELPTILPTTNTTITTPKNQNQECLSTPNKHKSCRCIRCISRYGYLGAKTRESYIQQSPMNISFNTKYSLKRSKKKMNSDKKENQNIFEVDFNSDIMSISEKLNSSNLSFTLEESEFNNDININNYVNNNENGNENEISYLSNNHQLNLSIIPQTPVVVIESSCTMSDHLKVRNKFIIN